MGIKSFYVLCARTWGKKTYPCVAFSMNTLFFFSPGSISHCAQQLYEIKVRLKKILFLHFFFHGRNTRLRHSSATFFSSSCYVADLVCGFERARRWRACMKHFLDVAQRVCTCICRVWAPPCRRFCREHASASLIGGPALSDRTAGPAGTSVGLILRRDRTG